MAKKNKKNKSTFINLFKFSSIKILFLKLLIAFISIIIFYLIVYEAYNYVIRPVNMDNIPLVKYENNDYRQKPDAKDGIVFSNQNKMIYNSLNKNKTSKSNKAIKEHLNKEYSHDEIFKILENADNKENAYNKKTKKQNSQKNITPNKVTKNKEQRSTVKQNIRNKKTSNNPFSIIE